jgi:hypothetical protein
VAGCGALVIGDTNGRFGAKVAAGGKDVGHCEGQCLRGLAYAHKACGGCLAHRHAALEVG